MVKYKKDSLHKNMYAANGSNQSMESLYQQYCESVELLSRRIKSLVSSYKLLCSTSPEPSKDGECIQLKKRLDILIRLRTELKDIAKEIKLYYNLEHWRSTEYTMNAREPQAYRFVHYTDDAD